MCVLFCEAGVQVKWVLLLAFNDRLPSFVVIKLYEGKNNVFITLTKLNFFKPKRNNMHVNDFIENFLVSRKF